MSRNIVDYGAVADGETLNTLVIQKAIDDCAAAGGCVSEAVCPAELPLFKDKTFPGGMLLRNTRNIIFANTVLDVRCDWQKLTEQNTQDTDRSGIRCK